MTRRGMIGCVAGSVLLLAGCGLLNSHASYRFCRTVEATTPQGIVRGTSVDEVRAEKNNTRILAEERAGG